MTIKAAKGRKTVTTNRSFNAFNGGASKTILVEFSSDPFPAAYEPFLKYVV